MTSTSYIILGSGVFGASTALHLIRKDPGASITLIDRDAHDAPTRVAASWDWNKVIRADYDDILYCKLALEAQDLWRADPIWKPFYHESGVVWISPTSFAKNVLENHAKLGVKADLKTYSVDEAKELYGGVYAGADYTGIKEVLVNRGSGWAEAKEALRSTIEGAISLGVKYVVAEVTALELQGDGAHRQCRGVITADGMRIAADKVIICTGAYTPKLLMDSAPSWSELQAGERILACGVTEARASLDVVDRGLLDNMPVGINDNPVDRGDDVGCLPLPSTGALKVWGQMKFRNTITHAVTKEPLSTPPTQRDYAQWDVPAVLQDDVRWALRSVFGEKRSALKMEDYRICWDAYTPNDDFIVSPHPACDGLVVATCGSFHGFKFLPVIGKYVVQMLYGELDPVLRGRWAWTDGRDSNDHRTHRELRDIKVDEVKQPAVNAGL